MTEYRDPWGDEGNRSNSGPYGEPRRFGVPPGFGPFSPRPGVNPHKRILRQNSNAVCFSLTLVFGFSFMFVSLMEFLIWVIPGFGRALAGLSPVGNGIINMSVHVLAFLLPTLLIVSFLKMPLGVAFPMRRPTARLTVPGIFCLFGMSVFGVYIAAFITGFLSTTAGITPSMPDFSPPAGRAEIAIYLISLSIIPAVFEEFLCRGAVMQSLRRFGDPFALVMSSLLFAMLHRNFLQGPNAFLAGLVLGYFTLRSDSLVPAIIMHFINNLVTGFLMVAMQYMPASQAQILNFSIMPAYLALGAIGVVLMITLNGGFKPLRQTSTGLGEAKKYGLFFTAPLAIVFTIFTAILTWRFLDFG